MTEPEETDLETSTPENRWEMMRREESAALQLNLETIVNALLDAKGVEVVMYYNGEGDAGYCGPPVLTRADGSRALLSGAELPFNQPVADGSLDVDELSGSRRVPLRSWSPTAGWNDVRWKLGAAVETFMVGVLEHHYNGWEDNDGGEGTVTMFLRARAVTIAHSQYVQELLQLEPITIGLAPPGEE